MELLFLLPIFSLVHTALNKLNQNDQRAHIKSIDPILVSLPNSNELSYFTEPPKIEIHFLFQTPSILDYKEFKITPLSMERP